MTDTIHEHFDVSRNSLVLFLRETLTSPRVKNFELLDLVLQEVFNTFSSEITVSPADNGVRVDNAEGQNVSLVLRDEEWCIDGMPFSLDDVIDSLVRLAYPVQ